MTNPIEIQSYLEGIEYPAAKNDLLEVARGNHAPERILQVLSELPEHQNFLTPKEVLEKLHFQFA